MAVDIICADARDALAAMPEGSVHTCVTSPPYWGLRDYGLEPTVWGGGDCEHEWGEESYQRRSSDGGDGDRKQETNVGAVSRDEPIRHAFCRRCNAWRGTLGLEPTPELYVEHIVQVFRDVRRVLRDDGTLWLNLGDSYAGSGPSGASYQSETTKRRADGDGTDGTFRVSKRLGERGLTYAEKKPIPPPGLKPKDLVGVPWRVAFALQADDWWLRSDIVWSKPNPMPESVTDRPTRAHEYLFLLSKRARYHYDADAIREPYNVASLSRYQYEFGHGPAAALAKSPAVGDGSGHAADPNPAGRNRRSVWEIATQPYPKAHFATFPEKLVEPCILAGTSEHGCCPECGAPWERVVESRFQSSGKSAKRGKERDRFDRRESFGNDHGIWNNKTIGWRPTCDHEAEPVPCRVLDPFAGSGTVGVVAERLGRHSVLIDAKDEYCDMARERTAQRGLMVEASRE